MFCAKHLINALFPRKSKPNWMNKVKLLNKNKETMEENEVVRNWGRSNLIFQALIINYLAENLPNSLKTGSI